MSASNAQTRQDYLVVQKQPVIAGVLLLFVVRCFCKIWFRRLLVPFAEV